MRRLIRNGILSLATLAFLGVPPLAEATLEGQEATARFDVLVPNLENPEGVRGNFGRDVARQLREMINSLPTHRPVEERTMRDAAREYDMSMDDLNCIRARQLAGQMDSQVVFCGVFLPVDGDQVRIESQFVVSRTGDSFDVPEFQVHRDDVEGAAREIFDEFDRVVEQTRAAQFCQEYFGSQQYENALNNCNRAIELNPESVPTRYTRARALTETERPEEALEEYRTVLELDPIHENALQWAGRLASQLGDRQEAREYYGRYLELNPGNVSVRMNVAYELAQAGDPYGAMELLEEGFEHDPENIDLWEQYGNFAFNAASQQQRNPQQRGAEVSPEVAELYQNAIDAYDRVYEARGEETRSSQIRNVVAAHLQLGEVQEAASKAERFLETHGDEPRLWSIYSDALARLDRVEEAVEALAEVQRIDPDYANVAVRQGRLLLEANRIEEALERLEVAVERGEQPVDVVANLIFAHAHQQGVQREEFNYAIQGLEAAKAFDVSDNMRSQLDFWHAYSVYKQAEALQEPQTPETAERALPLFERAQQMFQAASSYAQEQESINLQQFLEAVETYIEIQEAILARAARGR